MKIDFLFGSFLFATTKAECPDGYNKVPILESSDFKCEEIDECEEKTHDCHLNFGKCSNTPGSFNCECVQGKR